MLVAIASMKGGVGKSTLAAMLAKHVAGSMGVSVTVVDMDPQRGATILLLGPRKAASHTGPTMYDVLQSELDNIPSHEILARAIVPWPITRACASSPPAPHWPTLPVPKRREIYCAWRYVEASTHWTRSSSSIPVPTSRCAR